MNTIVLLLSALIMVPSYKTAPVPCETEKRALGVVMWSQAPESSRWVMKVGGRWNEVTKRTEKFKRPWRWWFRRTSLRFDGPAADFKVTINGEAVGVSTGIHDVVEFDLTPHLKWFGENTIDVEVKRALRGRGIFREVLLVSTHKRAPKEIKVQTWLSDDCKKAKVTVTDEKGQVVKERDIDNPTLWNDEFPAVCVMPIEYHWGWWIFGGVEYRAVRFGFRKMEIRSGRVFLNGKLARLNAVAKHHSTPGSGDCTAERSRMVWDSAIIKSSNANAVRAADYPFSNDWYDLCDRDGICVLAEPDEMVPGNHPCVLRMDAKMMPVFAKALDGDDAEKAALKQRFRPVDAKSFDWRTGVLKIVSRYRFINLDRLDGYRWASYGSDGKELAKGELQEIALAPLAATEVKLEGVKGNRLRVEFVYEDDVIAYSEFERKR